MSCKADALKAIARKSYHSQELKKKLKEKGHPSHEIEEAVAYLISSGYLDDAQYLEGFARKAVRSGWGPLEVKAKLYQKGIRVDLDYDQEAAFQTCLKKNKSQSTLFRKGFQKFGHLGIAEPFG